MIIVFNEIWDSKKPFGHCLTLKRWGANGPLETKKEYRVVKMCLCFRKHNLWSQHGSSKYAANFAKMHFQIGQIGIYFSPPKTMDRLKAKFCICYLYLHLG